MNLTRNVFTITDLTGWMEDKTLIVNKEYQRGQGLWPVNARSFFIDTILNGFPFPKVIIWQKLDLVKKKTIREIIDGQQRLTTIKDFVQNKFALTNVSENYQGLFFENLDEDTQTRMLSYEVSIDTILGATREEVLEVFRRMNSYTLPLNYSEKRHATYQGQFKWFIADITKKYTSLFEDNRVFGERDVARMLDAEFFAEICSALENGIQNKVNSEIEKLYKKYDNEFNSPSDTKTKLMDLLEFLKNEFNQVISSQILKSYTLYSLIIALAYNKWGHELNQTLSSLNWSTNFPSENCFSNNINQSIQNILEIFNEFEADPDGVGRFGEFIKACKTSTNNKGNRSIRIKWMVAALQNRLSQIS
jgi:archaellum component FlaC